MDPDHGYYSSDYYSSYPSSLAGSEDEEYQNDEVKDTSAETHRSPPDYLEASERRDRYQYTTPQRAAVRFTKEFFEYLGVQPPTEEIFKFAAVKKTAGYDILNGVVPIRTLNHQDTSRMGRPSKVSDKQLEEARENIEKEGGQWMD